MAELSFYLRDQNAEKTTVYAYISYEGQRVKISTEIRIPSKFWNHNKQRVKEVMDFPDHESLNHDLDKIEFLLLSIYKENRQEGIVLSPNRFKQEFIASKDSPLIDKKAKTFWDHFEAFVGFKSKELDDIRDYDKALRKHLLKMEEQINRSLTFALIKNPEFSFNIYWENYLKNEAINAKGEPGLSMNTVGKQNKNLKVFLNWTFENGIYPRFSLKGFPTFMEEVDNIYLTESEITALLELELEEEKERKVRDLFIIGCETGLRFSDFTRIKMEDIDDGHLTFSPKKTAGYSNNKIIIPISARFEEVLRRNNNGIPKLGNETVTYFNQIIRSVCEKAKMTKEVKYQREVAGKTIIETRFRYQEVSSHTCRRTFCTLKFLKGMPAQAIMKFSGHRTERNFLKYLKLDAELTARKYNEYF